MTMNKTKYPMLSSSGPHVAWDSNQNKHVVKTDKMNTPLVTVTLRLKTRRGMPMPAEVCGRLGNKSMHAAVAVKDAPTIPKNIG
jgi:hypothetical protein